MDRKNLGKQLRKQATRAIVEAARADYERYRLICGRYPDVQPEGFSAFFSEWLENRYFDAKNAGEQRKGKQ